MPSSARPAEITSSAVTDLASSAGSRYVTPVTSVPRRTELVRAASAASREYDSNISCCGWPSIGSWKKWSITNTVSKPDCSAATAWAATRSNSWAGATPGYVKLGIWRPRWVRFMIESLDHRKSR